MRLNLQCNNFKKVEKVVANFFKIMTAVLRELGASVRFHEHCKFAYLSLPKQNDSLYADYTSVS